jgi:hypothetical protein
MIERRNTKLQLQISQGRYRHNCSIEEKPQMSKNRKQSSRNVAQLAAQTLTDKKASKTAKSLAGSALA